MLRHMVLIGVAMTLLQSVALAGVKTEVVEYKQGETVLEGFIAYPSGRSGPSPTVILVHDWMGVGDFVKARAKKLAEMGYTAFAADIYGKGVRAQDPKRASELATIYKNDRGLMRARIQAAVDYVKTRPQAMKNKIAAIGFCFGGTTVLELARSGADVRGVISFHGGLDTPNVEDAKNIKARVLVLHGADDPYVPVEQVNAFQEEMRKAKVDWEMVSYGGSVHSFTNPAAGSDNSKGAAYNKKADERSFEAMKVFFSQIF